MDSILGNPSMALSVAPQERLRVQGLSGGRWQPYRAVAAMVGVITSVLAGSTVGLLVAAVSNHSLSGALAAGGTVALVLTALMRYQRSVLLRAIATPLTSDEDDHATRS
jgi:hypothetical protein